MARRPRGPDVECARGVSPVTCPSYRSRDRDGTGLNVPVELRQHDVQHQHVVEVLPGQPPRRVRARPRAAEPTACPTPRLRYSMSVRVLSSAVACSPPMRASTTSPLPRFRIAGCMSSCSAVACTDNTAAPAHGTGACARPPSPARRSSQRVSRRYTERQSRSGMTATDITADDARRTSGQRGVPGLDRL